ncbi:MAG: hypothetical protein AMXMBFR47_07320 [Planctomycetota bacterium]
MGTWEGGKGELAPSHGARCKAIIPCMSSLQEIQRAADALPPAEKQELLLFLAARLRAQAGDLPRPRKFSTEQLREWIAEDEAALRKPVGR